MGLLVQIAGNSESVLSEMRGLREQIEALTVLRYEFQKERVQTDTLKPAKQLYNEIVRVSKASVEEIPAWFIPEHELEYDSKPFASGSFGALHRGTWGSGTKIVVKTLLHDELSNAASAMPQFLHEVQVWYDLRHPNVVRMFGACHVTSPAFIVCEDATHGNLATFLADHGQDSMWRLLHEAALGLEYLHRNRVVHGDLKLNNLLVGSNGAALVADFGLSFVNDSSAGTKIQHRGGLRWLAPECLTGQPSFESDVFSLAMCIVEAVQGEPPFAYIGDDAVMQNLRDGKLPARPTEMPDDAWDLVGSMTALDPSKRPPLSVVIGSLEHLKMTRDKSTSQTIVLQKPKIYQGLGESSDVYELVASLKSDSASIRYSALTWLYRKAEDDTAARAIKEAGAYQWLLRCLRLEGVAWDQQVFAYGCLRLMLLNSALTQAELDGVRLSAPTEAKMASLLDAISTLDREEDLVIEAVEKIKWIEKWDVSMKHRFFLPLTRLVCTGTEMQVAVAAQTVASLIETEADAAIITAAGTLPLLINQFDVTSDRRKAAAALLLAGLSAFNDIALLPRVIDYLVGQIRAKVTDKQTLLAIIAVQSIAMNSVNLQRLVDAGVYETLAELIREGNESQKCASVSALSQYMSDEATKRASAEAGAIPLLLELVCSGSAGAKPIASVALCQLARGSESRSSIITDAGIIPIVVDLIRKGDDATKDIAIDALYRLAWTESISTSIIAAGALVPIIELLGGTTDKQKFGAAGALANLASNNDVNRRAIRAAGGSPLSRSLLGTGMKNKSA